MPIPTARVVINVVPLDADGHTFIEEWTGDLSKWDVIPKPTHAVLQPLTAILPNDGPMGGPFLRAGSSNLAETDPRNTSPQPAVFFDQTQPFTAKYRMRLERQSDIWNGLGLLYNSEVLYDGLTSEHPGWLGQYENNLGPVSNGDVLDVEAEWDPAAWTLRYRVAKNGGAFSAWDTHHNTAGVDAVYALGAQYGACAQWPFTFMWGIWGAGYCDLGTVKLKGAPLWGFEDCVLIENAGWTHSGSAVIWGDDANGGVGGISQLGGLTGQQSDHLTRIDHNLYAAWSELGYSNQGISINASWSAQSPIIGKPPGYRYGYLDLHAYNHASGSKLKVFVRDAATGLLLPDSQIPGNSTGLISTASVAPAAAHRAGASTGYIGRYALKLFAGSGGTQRVSLAGVPSDRELYLDVQGTTSASEGTYINQARLGGAWIAFTARGFEADPVPAASNGAISLTGARRLSTSVTVSYPTAPWSEIGLPRVSLGAPAATASSSAGGVALVSAAKTPAPQVDSMTPTTVTVGSPFTISGLAKTPPPAVTGMSPTTVTVGETFTITGTAGYP